MKRLVETELAVLSRHLIKRFRPFIIGVTGSCGKTTTKYFIYELIKSNTSSVLYSSGNINTSLGLPLAILGYQKAPANWFAWLITCLWLPIKTLFTFQFEKFLILEYGADRPGDIEELVNIASPDITVITCIGSSHYENFKSEREISREKWKLALAAREAVILPRTTVHKIKDFNLEKIKADIFILPSMKYSKAENISQYTNKTVFDLYIANKKYESEFKFFGQHHIQNLELAVFASHLAIANDKEIVAAVKKLRPLPGRGRRFLSRDILIIDESYNANPASMKAALSSLKNIKHGRKVAILGQMSQLGKISKQSHQEIARMAKGVSDLTIGVGEGFKGLGLDRWYPDVSKLISEADNLFASGDVVFVKGSRWANRLDLFIKYMESK